MKKAILSIVLGLVCFGAYAGDDEAEAPIAAYADNPNQPGSEAAQIRGEEIDAAHGDVQDPAEVIEAEENVATEASVETK